MSWRNFFGFAILLGCVLPAVLGTGARAEAPRVFCLNPAALQRARERVMRGDPALAPALARLRAEADDALSSGPFSVTHKTSPAPSGDKHDYVSVGPYWWPDPAKPDGLPYIRRDGKVNPERYADANDSKSLKALVEAVDALALAHYLTGEDKYARHAARLLRIWFLEPATKMNPHLKYGQAIPGRVEGRGIGIIDTARLARTVDAVGLLAGSKHWRAADQRGMQEWFGAYLDWLLTSKFGKDEDRTHNNHGTWFDVQVASCALFAGRDELAKQVVAASRERRIKPHVKPDGSQPHELARTKSLGYSAMNLRGLMDLGALGERVGVDVWNYAPEGGGGIRAALDYLAPYADPEKKWPHKQIAPFGREDLFPLLRRGANAYGPARYEPSIEKLPRDAMRAHRAQLLYAPR